MSPPPSLETYARYPPGWAKLSRAPLGGQEILVEGTLENLPTGPLSYSSMEKLFAAPGMVDNKDMRERMSIREDSNLGNVLQVILPNSDAGVVFQPPLPKAFEKGYIQYKQRWAPGFPFGGGGKLVGLGGFIPPISSPPSGKNPSRYGWAGRLMWLRDAYGATNGIGTELIAYPYLPWLAAGSSGRNRLTGYEVGEELGVSDGEWRDLKAVYGMNTVNNDGVTLAENSGDGLHQIIVNDTPIFTKTNEVWRFYKAVKISHWSFACFYGGDSTWSGGGGIVEFNDFRVVKEL